jgi:hypothetical protein
MVISCGPKFRGSHIPSVVSRIVIHAVILGGLWRTAFDHAKRVRVWLAVAIPYAAWVAARWCATEPGVRSPLPLADFLPVIIGLPLLLRSRRMPSVLDATPPAWLVGLQVYIPVRLRQGWPVGYLRAPGRNRGYDGWPAHGAGRHAAAARRAEQPGMGHCWNILGLLDFVSAVGIGHPHRSSSSFPITRTRNSDCFRP